MREACDIEKTLSDYGPHVWRACAVYFSCEADAEDAYQETFLRYALADSTVFNDSEHKKAWLLRVATNICKDTLKSQARTSVPLESELSERVPDKPDALTQPGSFSSEVISAMRALDDPPRTPLYLALCEGYSAPEIAQMTESPVNTVYSWISRGKALLKEALR